MSALSLSKKTTAACLALALCGLIFRPGMPLLSSHVFGGASGDGGLYLFLLQKSFASLLPGNSFTLPAFYPYLGSLTWSDNYVLPSLVAQPFLYFLSPTLIHNISLILATALTGYCMFLLASELGLCFIGALFALISFEGFPFFAAHLGHAQLQWAFVFPLTVLLLRRALLSSIHSDFAYVGLCFVAALLTSVYYFIFLIVIATLTTIFSPRAPSTIVHKLSLLGAFVAPLIPFIPLLASYLTTKIAFGSRLPHEIIAFSATLTSYISPTPNSQWHAYFSYGQDVERSLFMGFVPLFFASLTLLRGPFYILIAVVSATFTGHCAPLTSGVLSWIAVITSFLALVNRKHSPITYWGIILCAGLICSFGFKGGIGVYDLAYRFIPSIDGVRAVSRWGVVAAFAISLLGALSASRYPKLGILGIAFLLFEVTPRTIGLEPLARTPEVFSQIPKNAVVIVLPLTDTVTPNGSIEHYSDFAKRNTNAMNWGAERGVTVVNGYSGVRSRFLDALPARLESLSSPDFLPTLFSIDGLTHIVLTSSTLLQSAPQEVQSLVESSGSDGSVLLRSPSTITLQGKISLIGRPGSTLRITAQALEDESTILFKGSKFKLSRGEAKTLESLFVARNNIPERIDLRSNKKVKLTRHALSDVEHAS